MSNLSDRGTLRGTLSVGSESGGTDNYNNLINKPSINSHELVGDQSGDDLDLINSDDLTFNVGHAGNILHNIKYKGRTYTIYAEPFRGATADSNGTMGLVRAPLASQGDYNKFLKGNGMWASINSIDSIEILPAPVVISQASQTLIVDDFSDAKMLMFVYGIYADGVNQIFMSPILLDAINDLNVVFYISGYILRYGIAIGLEKISNTSFRVTAFDKHGWQEDCKMFKVYKIR